MLDGRIYRVAFVPLLLALAVVGFSLGGRPGALSSTLAPDAFNGPRAFAELGVLASRFADRRPGSEGDRRLAQYLADAIRQAGGAAAGGFQVSERTVRAQTIDGQRTLRTVVAERPGSTGESPIAIVAHRDAAGRGAAAELSATAALLELARVFGHSETRRTIVLVSTSGGTGGYADTADFASHAPSPLDAALVLGDLAGVGAHKPFVVSFSAGSGAAPDPLVRTLAGAITQEVGVDPGEPGVGIQLAHLASPLVSGEQAPLLGAGIPAAMVQVDGARGPSTRERVSQARLQNFGRAVLSAVYALDEGPDVKADLGARLVLGRKTVPAWAVRLLALALLLPPLLTALDGLARTRRRRAALGRWVLWTLTCAAPFLAAAVFAMLLGRLGIVAAPAGQPSAAALAGDGSAPAALMATALVLVLSLAAWPALARRLSLPPRPSGEEAGLGAMLALLGLAVLVWSLNPFACLLLLPAAHVWLLVCTPHARRRVPALGAVLLGAAPPALLALAYARSLGLGPLGAAQSAVLALAGGQLGLARVLLWSVGLGCLLAVALLNPRVRSPPPSEDRAERRPITTRGPISYAGPGSLGGTESALRR